MKAARQLPQGDMIGHWIVDPGMGRKPFEMYVSPSGDDSGLGSWDDPVRTFGEVSRRYWEWERLGREE